MAKGGQSGKSSGSAPMREAWRLLEDGDVRAARRAAQTLLAGPPAPSVEDAAEAKSLLDRTAFPKDALKVGALAATLIVVLLILAVLRG